MENFTINFNNFIGNIKPMHAVGQPPFLGMDFTYCQYLTDANIPYSRLHDVGGKNGIYAVGASNGKENAVLITNTTVNNATIKTNLDGNYEVYLIDEKHSIALTNYSADSFKMKKNQVILIKNKAI